MDFSKQRREWTILRAHFGAFSDEGRRYSVLIESSFELEGAKLDEQVAHLKASMQRQSNDLVKMALR